MHDIHNYQVIQLISSAIGFFLTIMGAIARLTVLISREQFINVSFVALILLLVIPFFIEYVVGQNENGNNENQQNQEKITSDYREDKDVPYSC